MTAPTEGTKRRSWWLAAAMLSLAAASSAHDLERTQVSIVFARDGSFVADVANDPRWLALRLESFPGSFADRVVLWVYGHEIRPSSVEFIPPSARPELAEGARPEPVEGARPEPVERGPP